MLVRHCSLCNTVISSRRSTEVHDMLVKFSLHKPPISAASHSLSTRSFMSCFFHGATRTDQVRVVNLAGARLLTSIPKVRRAAALATGLVEQDMTNFEVLTLNRSVFEPCPHTVIIKVSNPSRTPKVERRHAFDFDQVDVSHVKRRAS